MLIASPWETEFTAGSWNSIRSRSRRLHLADAHSFAFCELWTVKICEAFCICFFCSGSNVSKARAASLNQHHLIAQPHPQPRWLRMAASGSGEGCFGPLFFVIFTLLSSLSFFSFSFQHSFSLSLTLRDFALWPFKGGNWWETACICRTEMMLHEEEECTLIDYD